MKIVFFGTPEFALPILEALLKADDIDVVGAVTQPDRPAGRDHLLTPPPIKVVAQKSGIPVLQFPSLKKSESVEALKKLNADVFVVFSYGKMIPADVLAIPRFGCLNVHPSLLPLYRGPTPVPAAILHGDTKTGVSIMLLDEGIDTGPILAQAALDISSTDTTPTLMHKLIHDVGAPLLVETLRRLANGQIKPQPQDNAKATLTRLLDRDSGMIDWSEPAEVLERKIRAYTPWPGTYTVIQHRGAPLRVKILKAKLTNGSLELQQVQPEGGKVMGYEEFKRGYGPIPVEKAV